MPRFHGFAPAVAACALLVLAGAAAAAPERTTLLAAGPATIRFAVDVGRLELVAPADSAELAASRVAIRLDEFGGDGLPGGPRLPSRVVRVAVPPTGAVTVRGTGLSSETREGVELERMPGSAGPNAAAAPLERARLMGVSWLRNQRVASIAILPVDYDADVRRLTSYARIEVEVSVAPGTTTLGPFERDDPFEPVYESVLVNYEQGRSWRRPDTGPLANLATRSAAKGSSLFGTPTSSVFAGHHWVKIAIPASGFYRINYGQLRALVPFAGRDTIPYANLRLVAWPGRPVLSENVPCDACDYRQVAISVEDYDGSGTLNDNRDAFSFYALGPSDWADHFDPSFADTVYINHPYETRSYVFLSFSSATVQDLAFTDAPARILANAYDVTPNPDGSENLPVSFRERQHLEFDNGNEYFPSTYMLFGSQEDGFEPWAWDKFFWRSLTVDGQFLIQMRTPAPLAATPAYVRSRSYGTGAKANCGGTYYPPHLLDVVVNSPAGYDSTQAQWNDASSITARVFPVLDTISLFKIHVPKLIDCPSRFDQSSFAWCETYYQRRFAPDGDQLVFDSPGNGNAIYTIGPFITTVVPRMFDITDPFAPLEMKSDSVGSFGAAHYLRIEVNESGPRRYAFLPSASFLKPAAGSFSEASDASLDDLRGPNHAADFLAIYYDAFRLAADSLVAWRKFRLPLSTHASPYQAVGVPVSAVFDQFSGGRTDPAAIRNFLRAVYFNWHQGGHAAPTYVTLLGDASFDYRNLLGLARAGQPGCLIPAFENNIVGQVQYSTDDWLLNIDDPTAGAIPDFIGGRIPVNDPAGALDYVRGKLFLYERSAPNGTWRNRVMLIADDDFQGERIDPLRWTHMHQTSQLDSAYTPQHIDRQYIYLHTYPSVGSTKPEAKADIKGAINGDGVLMFNYIGHGSPFKLSDESVLIDVDAATFVNAEKLPLFVAASCDVGRFNDPRVQSLGERLLVAKGGGTVAVISATELAYSQFNFSLNRDLYAKLFQRDVGSGAFVNPVGGALLTAKLLNSPEYFSIQNNQKYTLMGDAALKLDLPQLWVDARIYDATGTTPVTEIRGGQTLMCKGQVYDHQGGAPVAYSGLVDLLIEDSAPRQVTPCLPTETPGSCDPAVYDYKAGAIFRGDLLVQGGAFTQKFIVPIESRIGPHGRVRAYVGALPGRPPQVDGVGSTRLQVSPSIAPPADDEGPSISLLFEGGVTSVKPDATLRIELSDPSGILTTEHTVQNGIVVTLDDNTTARTEVTSSFRYSAGSYTTGNALFVLPNLAAGHHNVKVSAADNMAAGLNALRHRSSASLDFEVAAAPSVAIRNAYLFPNPTESGNGRRSGGVFVIDGPGDSVNVMVRIFTVSGRLIRELTSFGQFGQVQIPWNGFDNEDIPLANGTYLFKVYVNGRDAKGRSTARQKASHDGRFVILNP